MRSKVTCIHCKASYVYQGDYFGERRAFEFWKSHQPCRDRFWSQDDEAQERLP